MMRDGRPSFRREKRARATTTALVELEDIVGYMCPIARLRPQDFDRNEKLLKPGWTATGPALVVLAEREE
jgi:hypothetical protein